MLALLFTALLCFATYLVLTAISGNLWLWSGWELFFAIVFSVIAGVIGRKILLMGKSYRMANPLKWLYFIAYLFPFFFAMAKANIDVAYRVITGRIKPGIVRISPNLRQDLSVTMLANSITLTPGTLSVDVEERTNDLFVHWINVKNPEPTPEEVCGVFPKWARRVAE